jgi:hypothetical protein
MQFLGRGEILGVAISDICFGRSRIRPVRGGLDTNTGYASRARSDARGSVFFQEFLDEALDFAIIAFSKVVEANAPFRVDEILGWPSFVIKRTPNLVVGVYGDWVSNLQIAHGGFHVFAFFLERELRGVRRSRRSPSPCTSLPKPGRTAEAGES